MNFWKEAGRGRFSEPDDDSQDRELRRLSIERGKLGIRQLDPSKGPQKRSKPRDLKACQQIQKELQSLLNHNVPLDRNSRDILKNKIDSTTHYPKYKAYLRKLLSDLPNLSL